MNTRPLLTTLLLMAALPGSRAADYTLQIGNVTWTGSPGGYDCFNGTAYPNTVNFTITKAHNGKRSYAVTAGASSTSGSYNRQLASGGNRLDYQLYTTSSQTYVLKAPPAANANEVISGSCVDKEGTVIPLDFIFSIPPNQLVPPGVYQDQITFGIYSSFDDWSSPQDSQTILFTAVVIPGAILALVPTGSGFSSSTSQNLDFGTLTQGQNQSCDLLIRKNTSCVVTFNSLNHGVMKIIPTPTTDFVPYSCTANGIPLDLTSTATMNLPSGVSPGQDGNRLPVTITIGDPSGATAGDYQDQITITVAAM